MIKNDYEDELKVWFKNDPNSFLESFCYEQLPDCNKEVFEASLTDIETENYEEDKHNIDDDFMPEAKEENILKETENFGSEAVEKVKNIRDNILDLLEAIDEKARQFLSKSLLENDKIRPHLNKFLKQEHFDIFLNYWYLTALSLLISILLPLLFLLSLSRKSGGSAGGTAAGGLRKSTKKVKVSKIKVSSSSQSTENTSESEAAEADDENEQLVQSKKPSSLRKSGSKTSPIKRASKRNSKSQTDN